MEDLLVIYKGDQSNYDCLKTELENVLNELEMVNRLKVDKQFSNQILNQVKKMRLDIQSIID